MLLVVAFVFSCITHRVGDLEKRLYELVLVRLITHRVGDLEIKA